MQLPVALAARTLRLALCSIFMLVVMAAFAAGGARAAAPVATDVSAGMDHTCAVIDAAAWCWGYNEYGQLGDGSNSERQVPTAVDFSAPAPAITQVSASNFHSCALDTNGEVWCWGRNNFGQLGKDGTGDGWADATTPVKVDFGATPPTITQVSVGTWHTCAIDTTGKAWCWGHNGAGRLGVGTEEGSGAYPDPVTPTGLGSDVTQISAGGAHSCAVVNGEIKCWGWNVDGQLGNGNNDTQLTPVTVNSPFGAGSNPLDVSVGESATCAVTTANALYCWGNGADGYLGYGWDTSQSAPLFVAISEYRRFTQPIAVSVGWGHLACLQGANGRFGCWGRNDNGQAGDGVPQEVAWDPHDVVDITSGGQKISAGGAHACAVVYGWLECWGAGANGRLGSGGTGDQERPGEVAWPVELTVDPSLDGTETTDPTITLGFNATGHPAPSCTVDGSPFAGGNQYSLDLGENTITIACTNATSSASQVVTVTRNGAPAVTISAPTDGTETTDTTIPVEFTVTGYPEPGCKVDGYLFDSGDYFSLSLGQANTITVECKNTFDSAAHVDSAAVTVTQGTATAPSISNLTSSAGTSTEAAITTLTWTTGGFPTPTCTVNGDVHSSGDAPPLIVGDNTFDLSCTNGEAPDATDSITVTRNVAPSISGLASNKSSPTEATETTLTWVADGYPTPSCTVNDNWFGSDRSATLLLYPGPNQFNLVCSNDVGSDATASISITRNVATSISNLASSAGTSTEADSTDLTWSVSGYPIPTCTVGGAPHDSGDGFDLAAGDNTFVVACTNGVGSDATASITVTQNVAPSIDDLASSAGTTTEAGSTNLTWSVSGYPIPTCKVNDIDHSSGDAFNLAVGDNTFNLSCTNSVLPDASDTIIVTRNVAPSVTIGSPADGSTTAEQSLDVSFTATGYPAPTCTVNGAAAASSASVALAVGANTISVLCTNSAGSDARTVTVTRSAPPVAPPAEPPAKPAITAAPKSVKVGRAIKMKVSCVAGCTITPQLKIGKKKIKGVKSLKVKAGATSVQVKLSKKVTAQIKKALKKSKRTKVVLTLTPQSAAGKGPAKSVGIKR